MSGKRAKPSPWRFLRATPVAVVAVVVWVIVGLFFLLPGSGSDQAHDWGLDPIPSGSDGAPTDGDYSADRPSTPAPSGGHHPSPHSSAPTSQETASDPAAADDLELAGAPAPATKAPRPRQTSDPTDPPADSTPGPPEDNPGKKKGHDKPHGPHGRP